MGRQFELYAQSLSAAAAGPDRAVEQSLRDGMKKLADWWDRFATAAVSEMPRVQGQERTEAAEHVARSTALVAHRRGEPTRRSGASTARASAPRPRSPR